MRKLFAVAFTLLALSSTTMAQTGFRLKTRTAAELFAEQRRVVSTWCRQDFEGLRLATTAWERYKPLTLMKSSPDFNTIIIVSRFQFEARETSSWDVNVNYAVIGRYERGAGYTADPGMMLQTFQTKDVDDEILIVNLDPVSPHVSKKAAIEWMKKELETTTSDIEKIHLRDALKQLEPAAPSAPEPSK